MTSTNNLMNEGILVISCSDVPVENIILHIIGTEKLPEVKCHSNIESYPWCFETKYYSAEVSLYSIKKKETLNPELAESIKGLVFYFDDTKPSSFDEVLDWITYLKDIDPEVQLLILNNNTEGSKGDKTQDTLSWCVENHYELIELNTSPEVNDEAECSVKDVTGYDRVVQSLQSHLWANLVMKVDEKNAIRFDECKDVQECIENLSITDSAASESSSKCEVSKTNSNQSAAKDEIKHELDEEEQWLANILDNDDPVGESYEALFSRFASLKERAAGLSGDERKKFAEKVAIAFWRAMGGAEDEIEGLEEDDED